MFTTTAARAAPTPAPGTTGLAVFGCAEDEAAAFRRMAPQFGTTVQIVPDPLTEATVRRARGHRCVSVEHRTPMTAAVLRALRDMGVTCVSTRSIGRDHIDVEAAQALGVTVQNAPYSPDGVADHTLMLMLMALRGAAPMVRRTDALDFRLGPERGRELGDLCVGVVGAGRIGRAVTDRLRGFGCRVLVHDRRGSAPEHAPLDDLLRRSDIVTLHAPLAAGTRHLLDARRLALLRPGAIVVNTARGALIDTEALLQALESGALGGAALDVLEDEGPFRTAPGEQQLDGTSLQRLLRLPTVIISPHTAYYTTRALDDIVRSTLTQHIEFERTQHHD